jgi:prefoldin subunit 5
MKIKPRKPNGRPAMDKAFAHEEAEFPSARYFQIHFEHLEGLLLDTKQHLDALKQQISEVRQMNDGRQQGQSER